MKIFRSCLVFTLLIVGGIADAEDLRNRIAEIQEQRKKTLERARFAPVKANWLADGEKFWYRRPNGEIDLITAATGERTPGYQPVTIEQKGSFIERDQLSRNGGSEIQITFKNQTSNALNLFWIDPGGKRISYGSLPPGESRPQRTYAHHVWAIHGEESEMEAFFEAKSDGDLAEITDEVLQEPLRRNQSPDGKWEVLIKDHNVVLRDRSSKKIKSITTDGTAEEEYSGQIFWSPDSAKFVVLKVKHAAKRKIHIVESSPDDSTEPKLHSINYVKPGDELSVSKPKLFDITGKEKPVPDDLFRNPFGFSNYQWVSPNEFTFLYNQRGHQVLRVISLDAATGLSGSIIEETSPTFIDYHGKQFSKYIKNGHEWIWMSERDGWNHLYLYDVATGKVKNQITSGNWVVRGVDRVDEEKRQIWFRAGGIYPDQDPYHVHYCRINFDGTNLTKLTDGDGTHHVEYSPDRSYLIDTYSRVDLPPVTELRRAEDGSKICELERSEIEGSEAPLPERFVAKGRDGKTDIYGVIFRPSDFDETLKYPVIEKIYAGPHAAFAPKTFNAWHSAQDIAEHGFIVIQIDGMGTSFRSKAFHDIAWKNLKDSGFPDRIKWIKAAAKKYPAIDTTRVGIYGGSAGGQSTLAALLWHGDFYRVGVSDCGCHDNRMDKIWWNELWMGWPVDQSYEENSNVKNAHRLTGKLLLTVGELDKNVDPASTMQVVDALIKADKDFEMIVVPGAGHGVGESPYLKRRRIEFFSRHLK